VIVNFVRICLLLGCGKGLSHCCDFAQKETTCIEHRKDVLASWIMLPFLTWLTFFVPHLTSTWLPKIRCRPVSSINPQCWSPSRSIIVNCWLCFYVYINFNCFISNFSQKAIPLYFKFILIFNVYIYNSFSLGDNNVFRPELSRIPILFSLIT